MKYFKFLLAISYLFFTKVAYAQIGLNLSKQKDKGIKVSSVGGIEDLLKDVFTNIIVLLFTVGALGFIIMFVWGTVDWILSGGDKEKIAGARKRIITAITGLVLLALTFVIAIIVGQVLGLCALRQFQFIIPRLVDTTTTPCK